MNGIGYKAKYDDYVVDYLLNIVKEEKEYGARPIARAIQDEIEDRITDLLLENEYEKDYEFSITWPHKPGTPSMINPVVPMEPVYEKLVIE